ncbi:MAG: hypothetical protein WBF04_00290, partial [Candidatus Sulfotelmatobacter sp.]
DDDPFTGPSTYCRRWSAPRIIFPLPHASAQVTKHEQFRHGLLENICEKLRTSDGIVTRVWVCSEKLTPHFAHEAIAGDTVPSNLGSHLSACAKGPTITTGDVISAV